MGYCVLNRYNGDIAWCQRYLSALMMAKEFGAGTSIVRTPCRFLRDIVTQIRQSW